jgi:Rad3-related DNA helicase
MSRPNPDELLAKIEQERARAKRGRLKIFFGAAAGVGKTYAMLLAAREPASVARMKRSVIRDNRSHEHPHYATLHAGYSLSISLNRCASLSLGTS